MNKHFLYEINHKIKNINNNNPGCRINIHKHIHNCTFISNPMKNLMQN